MDNKSLVRMANRIGDFFEAMPNRDAAMADITDHIRKFWVPRMRRQILDHIELHGGHGLSEIVWAALTRHRAELEVQLDTHSATSTEAAVPSRVELSFLSNKAAQQPPAEPAHSSHVTDNLKEN